MKKPARKLLVLSVLFVPAHALHAQTFEGVIRERELTVPPAALAKLVGSAETPDTAKLFKIPLDSLFAIALPPALPDGQIRSSGTINPSTRQAMVMPFDAIDKMGGVAMNMARAAGANAASADTAPHIRRLSKTREIGNRKILGFVAVGFETIVNENRTVEWDAMELLPAKQAMAADMSGMMREMGMPATAGLGKEPEHGMTLVGQRLSRVPPMLARMMGSGYSFHVSQVLSVERGPVADSMFEVPAGYSKVDVGAMLSGPKPPATTP